MYIYSISSLPLNLMHPLNRRTILSNSYRKVCFPLPANNTGLDYRKLLIINDEKYIDIQDKLILKEGYLNW